MGTSHGVVDPNVAVLLVRHGESTWNRSGRWQGHADPPLSPTGHRQAQAAAGATDGFDTIWSSDLVRARRTAELMANPHTVVRVEPRFRERDVGEWAGLTRSEIEARDPGFLAQGRRPARWENDARVVTRVLAALQDVAAVTLPGGVAIVVTHGGLIRAVELRLGGSPRSIPNLGGVWLHRDADGLTLGARVRLVPAGELVETAPVITAE